MRQLLAGMSPRSGVSQVPRLRAETHFGVQARALLVGLHILNKSVPAIAGLEFQTGFTLCSITGRNPRYYTIQYFHWIGATAKITALQRECEVIWASRSLFQRYKTPQKAPATKAARMSIRLQEKIWTPP